MKHTYHTKMRTALWAALGMACFAATLGTSSTWAQSGCVIINGTRACPVGPEPGGGSGTSPGPSGPSPEEVKQQRERQRLKAKAWSSDEALDYFDRKDWDNAIRSFEEALDRDPDDPDLNDWLKRAKAEKEKARMPAVASPVRPAPTNGSKVVDTRSEPAGLGGKSKSTGTLATPKPVPKLPSGDPMLVDARNVPSGLPKALDNAIAKAYASAPPGVSDRVRKGFQAVMVRDWKVAKAWFQDALNRDPNNAGLKRLAALTDVPQQPNPPRTSVDARNEPAGLSGKSDAKGAGTPPSKIKPALASTTGAQVQLPDPNDVYLMFPGLKAIEDKQALDYLFGLNAQLPASKSGQTK